MYGVAEKRADLDGSYYCVRCSDELGKQHLSENVCSGCNRSIGNRDVKFVMPSSMFGAIPTPISKRLLCTDCYKRFATRSVSRVRLPASSARRSSLMHNKLLIESVQF